MPGKSAIDHLFRIRQLVEKYGEKNKMLCMVFINLKKTYNIVPREVFKWASNRKEVLKIYINLIYSRYNGSSTIVYLYLFVFISILCLYEKTEHFNV